MKRVRLVGPIEGSADLALETEDGERLTLAITDDLRDALRHARAVARDATPATLSPKEIQRRIRSGLTAAELAELSGAPLDQLQRYEAPVLAERAYIADLAQTTRIGRDTSAPILGDLVSDRLASRGVRNSDVQWDAWRDGTNPWHVAASFPSQGKTVIAVWTFDHSARTLTAEDDEARWLTETELLDVPSPRRHLSTVRTSQAPAQRQEEARRGAPASAAPTAAEEPASAPDAPRSEPQGPSPTEELLDDLNSRRGTRDAAPAEDEDLGDDEEFEGFGPMVGRQADVGFTAPPAPEPEPGPAAAPESDQQPEPSPRESGRKSASRKGRASVPSWDEIVFGARSE